MKALTLKTTLAAVTLAAATLTAPSFAHASDYRNCSDTQNAVLGGVVGGSLGTVIGEEIAGRGDKTEGAILGAIIGGIAGAAVGDGASDCEKVNRNRRGYTVNHRTQDVYRPATIQTVHHRGNNRNYGYNTGHNGNGYNRLNRIDRRIDNLRRERAQLKDEQRYSRGYRPGIQNRLDRIKWELKSLKDQRRNVKNRRNYRNDYQRPRRVTNRRGHYHGGSTSVCYSDH